MTFSELCKLVRAAGLPLAILAACFAIASCGGGSGGSSLGNFSSGGATIAEQVAACEATLPQLQTANLASNEASIIVDAGPCAYGVPFGSAAGTAPSIFIIGAANAPYTSVTICLPGTTTCQTIDHVLVDTGSAGLRIMSSVLNSNMSLPAVSVSGAALYECAQFADGYAWGAVRSADVTIGGPNNNGELAQSVNIEVIGDPSAPATAPTACSQTGPAVNDVASFGANGVLGIGLFVNDCVTGASCNSALLTSPLYYNCSPSTGACTPVGLTPSTNQVSNPVASFVSTDFEGVVMELPTITNASGEENVYGTLVFGIASQINNAIPGTASVYVADGWGDLQSQVTSVSPNPPYSPNTQTCVNSFIDSGSNGLFLPSSVIPALHTDANGWFIPSSTLTLNAVITGATGVINPATNNPYTPSVSPSIPMNIANADTVLFPANNGNNTAFNDLGGTASGGGLCVGPPSGSQTSANATAGMDWGLPFFYGRSVFVANEYVSLTFPASGANATSYTTPFWAF